jgi:anti-anti-sigma factor
MGKDIEIRKDVKGDIAILYIKGDLTAVTGALLTGEYNSGNVAGTRRVVLDFDKNCYINSGGIAFLIDIATSARKKGQKICVTGLSEHFKKIFHMVGLTRCMQIYASEAEAIKSN